MTTPTTSNLGNIDACDWCVEFVSTIILNAKIDVYRQDCNIEPLLLWRSNDTAERQGITEIKAVNGLYHFWNKLRHNFPNLLIDNCASGGRRLDIELLRYSVPLWGSDMQCFPEFNSDIAQTHISGLSLWLPFFSMGTQNESGGDTYNFRSALAAGIVCHYFMYERIPLSIDYPHEWLKMRLKEFHTIKNCMSGDFYPLVEEISHSKKIWSITEFYRPDIGQGALFVFRRNEAPFISAEVKLAGLESDQFYDVFDFDTCTNITIKGYDLMHKGLNIIMSQPHTSKLIYFHFSVAKHDGIEKL